MGLKSEEKIFQSSLRKQEHKFAFWIRDSWPPNQSRGDEMFIDNGG